VARRFPVGAAGEPDVVGVVRTGGEGLLPVDDVGVAVPDRAGPQRREVGAGRRLGVPDGEVELAGEDPREEEVLLCRGPERLQGRADGLQCHVRQRHVGARRLVDEDLLLDRAEPVAAVLGRPADAEPAVPAHPPHERAVDLAVPLGQQRGSLRRGQHGPEVLPQLGRESLLRWGKLEVHQTPISPSRCSTPPSSRTRSLVAE
jgi:hypothetical protein